MLNLYSIERQDPVGYDETDKAIIAAATPKLARELAKSLSGDQSPDVWAHGKAKLSKIGTAGPRVKQGVIMSSYCAG
jgi:hypothetical protein